MSIRKYAPCRVCVALNDERDKEIHGLGLCERHYKAHLRRNANDVDNQVTADRHRSRELKAHQFVAQRFQRFLHDLNHENVTTILAPEMIQEIRLLVSPVMTVSQRIAVPKSLPPEMLRDSPLDILRDSPLEEFEGTVPSESEDAYHRARQNEIMETAARNRGERRKVMLELIQVGYEALEKKYTEPEAFALLASGTKLLRSMAGSDVLDE
jgi:hypothetical protein